MKEAAIHAVGLQQAHAAGVAIGQNRFRTELFGRGEQVFRDGVERFLPGDTFESPFALGAYAPLRIEEAIG